MSTVRLGFAFDREALVGSVGEIRIGAAAHDVGGLWSGVSKERGVNLCAEVIFDTGRPDLLGAAIGSHLGISVNTSGDTSMLYGGILLQWSPWTAVSVATGVGLALHTGQLETASPDRKALGSRLLFRIPIEIGYAFTPHHRAVIVFDHVSNAYLASPNEGLDTVGVRYAYRF